MKATISDQAQRLTLAITRKSAMRLDELRGQSIELTIEDVETMYKTIGMSWVAETLMPTIDELLAIYGPSKDAQ